MVAEASAKRISLATLRSLINEVAEEALALGRLPLRQTTFAEELTAEIRSETLAERGGGLDLACIPQGQAMLDKNLSVLPRSMYDPTATQADIARGQLLFINNCVTPMFHAWTMLFPNAKAMQSFIDGTMSNAMRLQIVVDAQLIPQSAAKPQRQSPAIRADGAVARRLSGD
jgi:hypothetical protein